MLKNKLFFQKIILLMPIYLFLVFTNQVFALRDNEFSERTIRKTEIIHVILEPDADHNTVLNYIQTNINPNFNGSVNHISSYNADKEGSINWYIKDEDEILAVYFDGGTRNKRDNNYDFVDLRWLGNGSPHMYCFWKLQEVDVLQHHDILKAKHAVKNNPLVKIIDKTPGLKNITIKKIMKKIAQKVSKRTIKTMSLGNLVIDEAAGFASEKLVDLVGDILELNPDFLELASSLISKVEDFAMNATALVDDIPVVRDLARVGWEGCKTYEKATDYPANVLKEVGKNLLNQKNYQAVNNPLDVAENVSKGTMAALEGVGKATVNTVRDVGYGVQDTVIKIFNPISFLWK